MSSLLRPSLTTSYTSFEFNHLQVRHEHIAGNDTVQATNEKFAGEIGLYDYVVSAPCWSSLTQLARRLGPRHEHGPAPWRRRPPTRSSSSVRRPVVTADRLVLVVPTDRG